MKKFKLSFLLVAVLFFFVSVDVKAEAATTLEVNSQQEFANAITQIHSDSDKFYIISMKSDITINDTSVFSDHITIDNGNTVTILGNGHTLVLPLESVKLKVNSATLNLGNSNKNVLNIEGPGSTGATNFSLVTLSGSTLNMYDGVTLSKNYSGSRGLSGCGVRVGDNSTFNMKGGVIKDNATTTGGQGGAVAVDGYDSKGVFNMSGGELKNNTTSALGGAIFVSSGNKVNITGGTISGNTAQHGGAIANQEGVLSVKNATITGNKCTYYGGAILNTNNNSTSNVSIDSSTITKNTGGYGGAIMNLGDEFKIENSTITENKSSAWGGGIVNYTGSLISNNNTIKNNKSSTNGGGIYARGTVTSTNDDISLNNADIGGGIYIVNGSHNFSTTKIYNNKAATSASDIYISSSVTSISLIDPATMGKKANIDDKFVKITGWFVDGKDNRWSTTHFTDKVSTITAGNTYYLVAATDDEKNISDTDDTPEEPSSDSDSKSEDNNNNPKTGDNISVYLLILTISISGFSGVVLYKKKKA